MSGYNIFDQGDQDKEVTYNREVLVQILVYHYRTQNSGCGCGWGELGQSHSEHVADIYEESMKAR